MKVRTCTDSLFSERHASSSGIILVLLRVVLGLQFFLSGFSKITSDWSADAYLSTATGPFAKLFQSMAGHDFISLLNGWGMLLIGLALIVGLLVRPASFFGASLMILYYFAHFTQNTANGFIDSHIIYLLLFVLMACGGFGHAWGLDCMIFDRIRSKKWWRAILFG